MNYALGKMKEDKTGNKQEKSSISNLAGKWFPVKTVSIGAESTERNGFSIWNGQPTPVATLFNLFSFLS